MIFKHHRPSQKKWLPENPVETLNQDFWVRSNAQESAVVSHPNNVFGDCPSGLGTVQRTLMQHTAIAVRLFVINGVSSQCTSTK
jgi:hypothetical protein